MTQAPMMATTATVGHNTQGLTPMEGATGDGRSEMGEQQQPSKDEADDAADA